MRQNCTLLEKDLSSGETKGNNASGYVSMGRRIKRSCRSEERGKVC